MFIFYQSNELRFLSTICSGDKGKAAEPSEHRSSVQSFGPLLPTPPTYLFTSLPKLVKPLPSEKPNAFFARSQEPTSQVIRVNINLGLRRKARRSDAKDRIPKTVGNYP